MYWAGHQRHVFIAEILLAKSGFVTDPVQQQLNCIDSSSLGLKQVNSDQPSPKLKSSLHPCSPSALYSGFGWDGIFSGNKCFIWCASYHRKPVFLQEDQHIHTIFPVETLRSSIAILSKKNLVNDGCIEHLFFFNERNRCL